MRRDVREGGSTKWSRVERDAPYEPVLYLYDIIVSRSLCHSQSSKMKKNQRTEGLRIELKNTNKLSSWKGDEVYDDKG
jgi:hypothetical protein